MRDVACPHRAVLFDMDGVLVDSFEMWLHAMNEAARALDCPAISRDRLQAVFGQGVEEDLRVFYRGCSRPQLEAAYAAALPHHARRMRPNPQARGVLDALGRSGVARAVVTNTPQEAVPPILQACGLADALDTIVGVRPGVREKPAADVVLAACRALDTPPAAALVVGDSDYDREAAAAAGVPFRHYDLRDGTDLARAVGLAPGHG